jgi:hypothetical protein
LRLSLLILLCEAERQHECRAAEQGQGFPHSFTSELFERVAKP